MTPRPDRLPCLPRPGLARTKGAISDVLANGAQSLRCRNVAIKSLSPNFSFLGLPAEPIQTSSLLSIESLDASL
jgi:hypothetical protein